MATLYTVLTDGYGIEDVEKNRVVDGYYTNTITPVYRIDSKVTGIKLVIKDGNNLLFDSGKVNLNKTQTYMYKTFDLSQIDGVQEDIAYTLTVTLWENKSASTSSLRLVNTNIKTIEKWTKVRRPSFNNLCPVSEAGVLSPFREENNYQFDSFLTSLNDLTKYALTKTTNKDSFSIKAILSDGNNSPSCDIECSLEDSKLKFNLTGSQVLKACESFNFSNNIPEVTLTLSITNNHGAVFSSQPIEVRLPKTPVVDVSGVSFTLRFKDVSTTVPNYMTKGCKLQIKGIKIKSLYQPTKLTISMVKNQIVREYDLNDINPDTNSFFEYTVNLGGTNSGNTLSQINIDNNFDKNLSIDYNIVKITVENEQNIKTTKETGNIGVAARGMKDGAGKITSYTFDDSGNLSLNLMMDHYGALTSLVNNSKPYVTFSARLYYKDSLGNWTKRGEGSDQEMGYLINNTKINSNNIYTLNNFDMSALGDKVQIKIVCKIRIWPFGKTQTYKDNTKHATEYSYEIEQKELIKGGPTLSYRKNSIGINYSFPDATFTDAVLVVGPTTNKNKVVFKRSGSGDNIIFDLSAGTMSGLTIEIDGGEWT